MDSLSEEVEEMVFGIRHISNDGTVVKMGEWIEGNFQTEQEAGARIAELERDNPSEKYTVPRRALCNL
jgi:hypothetical protein